MGSGLPIISGNIRKARAGFIWMTISPLFALSEVLLPWIILPTVGTRQLLLTRLHPRNSCSCAILRIPWLWLFTETSRTISSILEDLRLGHFRPLLNEKTDHVVAKNASNHLDGYLKLFMKRHTDRSQGICGWICLSTLLVLRSDFCMIIFGRCYCIANDHYKDPHELTLTGTGILILDPDF